MRNSLLANTLKLLDSSQWEGLGKFICSPFFSEETDKKGSEVLKLFSYLKSNMGQPDEHALGKEVVFRHIFPATEYNGNALAKVMTSLHKLVKQYIAYSYMNSEDEFQQELALARFYRENQWEERFQSSIQKLEKIISEITDRGEEYYWKQYLLHQQVHLNENYRNQRKGDLDLPAVIQNLDYFYLLSKLKYQGIFEHQKKFVKLEFIEPVSSEYLKKACVADIITRLPMFACYEQISSLLHEEEDNIDEAIGRYRELLKKHKNIIPTDELRHFQSFLSTFCTAQVNSGKPAYLQVLFELYKERLEMGTLYEKGGLLASTFLNIVMVGSRIGQFDWVEGFLKSHKGRIIGTDYPEAVYNFNQACYFFYRGNYDEAWSLIEGNYEDIFYKLAAKRMEIKILYEQENYDLMDARINSFKVFISRSTSRIHSGEIKAAHNAFISAVQQILSPATLSNARRIEKIERKILEHQHIAEREWLLEKVSQLKKKGAGLISNTSSYSPHPR
ncbi:MAG: hypothetical protein EPO28_00275 [Saprospiraceae bacterium]|nr:MAG: hypothetical protein EPO28_00275 [Saprospiraceae bacterium]